MTLETYAQSPMTISTDFTVTYGTGYPKGEEVLFEPDNYDTDVTEIAGVWTAGTTEDKATYKVIDNPAKYGINTSAKCLEVTCRNTDGSIGIDFYTLLNNQLPNLNGRRRISMLFKAGKNNKTQEPLGNGYYTQMQLETNYDDDGIQYYCLGAYYDAIDNSEAGHDGWKRLYFDFTPYNTTDNNYHTKVIGDYPSQLVFKPKICKVTLASDNRTITWHGRHNCSANDVYYIDEIKIEDVPYAEGYWINDDTNLPKGEKKWNDAEQRNEWNTASCALPKNGSNGVLHLSGTWLKGENLVNPEIWENNVEEGPWVYEFNEYRDLSWHVKPEEVKLMVFHKDSKLRWGDRGGLLGTNTAGDVEQGYPARFINNLNVLIFAEKSCILPDEVDNLAANWHDTNAVIHYSNDNSWKAWELELTDDYPFLNPQEFTVENLIKIHRGMKEGFNALVYPFALTAEELCCSRVGTIYHHKDANKLYFVPKTATEANVPYITENFKSTFIAGEVNVGNAYQEFKGSRTVSTVDENHAYASEASTGKLYGVYQRTNGNDKWGFADGVFQKGGPNSSFKTFRAYLDFPEGSAAKMFSRFNLEMMELTGVSMTDANNKDNNSDYVYDLYGRRYPRTDLFKGNLPRQIYIVDGKKVIK